MVSPSIHYMQRVRQSLPSGGAAGVKSSLSWVAGLVVVGDEILSGKVEDSNIRFLCTKLYEIGWTVRKVGVREGECGRQAGRGARQAAAKTNKQTRFVE